MKFWITASGCKASFGRHLTVIRRYDPSLPDVRADRELLVQCFLNLFKMQQSNKGGDNLTLSTSYSSHVMFPG